MPSRYGRPRQAQPPVGLPAIAHSVQYALDEMGAVRGTRDAAEDQPDRRVRLPVLRLARSRPPPRGRVLRERRQGGRRGRRPASGSTPRFFADHSIAELREQTDHWLEAQRPADRADVPGRRAPTHYEPISWDAALTLIADELRALPDPDRAVFYTSGRASNEAAFLYQLLARKLGTNNLPDCSNMCHESSGLALTQTIGVGKGTVTLDDIADHADLIVIVGQNPGTNHPRMLTPLEQAKQRGARIVASTRCPRPG